MIRALDQWRAPSAGAVRWGLAGLVLVLTLVCALDGFAKSSRIGPVSVTRQQDAVLVNSTLEGGFPGEVVEQIRRGVPKDLFYTVTLKRRHRHFFDEEVAAITLQYTLKYDTLNSRYHIRRTDPDGAVTEQEVVTYAEALEVVSQVNGVSVTVPATVKNGTLYAAVKAEMRAVRLPLYLNYVFFFIPILEFETPWARSANLDFAR